MPLFRHSLCPLPLSSGSRGVRTMVTRSLWRAIVTFLRYIGAGRMKALRERTRPEPRAQNLDLTPGYKVY